MNVLAFQNLSLILCGLSRRAMLCSALPREKDESPSVMAWEAVDGEDRGSDVGRSAVQSREGHENVTLLLAVDAA